ncbi:MAG: type II toxin-antitoxin system RelE/ParE family toxin [Thermoplasmata archaeon]|nr:MAG: type II toxin-antitoxin system RelE/ParE family toxin [Thermoplasmata archaeon]
MSYAILLHPKANDFLKTIEKNLQQCLKQKIKELRSNPKKGKKLKYSDFYRLQIGEYRVIYELDLHKEQVTVLFIEHRKNVYDDFSRLI